MRDISEVIAEYKKITDKFVEDRDAAHKEQCDMYRDEIKRLKDTNMWYHNFIQDLFKKYREDTERLKLDPSGFWDNPFRLQPSFGVPLKPSENWGGQINCTGETV